MTVSPVRLMLQPADGAELMTDLLRRGNEASQDETDLFRRHVVPAGYGALGFVLAFFDTLHFTGKLLVTCMIHLLSWDGEKLFQEGGNDLQRVYYSAKMIPLLPLISVAAIFAPEATFGQLNYTPEPAEEEIEPTIEVSEPAIIVDLQPQVNSLQNENERLTIRIRELEQRPAVQIQPAPFSLDSNVFESQTNQISQLESKNQELTSDLTRLVEAKQLLQEKNEELILEKSHLETKIQNQNSAQNISRNNLIELQKKVEKLNKFINFTEKQINLYNQINQWKSRLIEAYLLLSKISVASSFAPAYNTEEDFKKFLKSATNTELTNAWTKVKNNVNDFQMSKQINLSTIESKFPI